MTFALGVEFAPWRRRAGFEPDGGTGARQAYRMRQGDIEVSAVLTSVGAENAARVVAQVMKENRFDLVISSGLAGGLRDAYRPGHVLVGRSVRRLEDGRELVLPAKWVEQAKNLGAQEAVFVTSARVAGTSREKRSLGTEADAVEMESFAVVEQAAAGGVPGVVIRVISDPVEAELPVDFNRVFDARGRVRPARLAGELLRRPATAAGLVRMARESRGASAILAEFLDRYVNAAARNGDGGETGNALGK
ncbi:MAG TPA: hypothetical protein VNJ52_12415 [Patescibacteria group bacterium]|nr:hypothetical protein [Patescibacteria group bacterium]